ncbi:MAG: heavy metal translocating P-type ATPase [Betaproteobacteria bacterium]
MSPALAAPGAEPAASVLDDAGELATFTRFESTQDGRREAVSALRIGGIHCAACAGIIEDALLAVEGVRAARVAAGAQRAEVRWDAARTRASALVAAVERAGYSAAPDLAAPVRALREREQRRALWRLFVAGLCMMQVMMYATPAYVAAPGDIAPDLLRLLQWASWLLTLPVVLFAADGFFVGAWRSLRARRIGMDVPVVLGIAITFVASSAATFDPQGAFGREVYFDSLTMFVFFLLGGRWLELRARHRTAAALEAGAARLPESVLRVDADGVARSIGMRALRAGDHVRVARGQAFPADGVLLEGRTQADEALLTGESRPMPKQPGDALVAGSLNLHAPALMRVDRLGADTRYESIVALMRSAFTERPPLLRAADRIAGPFVLAVLLLAAGGAALWSVIDPARALWVAVSVLIVTCPCALSLAAPSALLAAAGALGRRGVLLRRLEALETLARVDLLFVDKTGTLTEDRLALQAVRLQPAARSAGLDERAVLAQAASLAALSTHPLSRALVDAAPAGDRPAAVWREVSDVPGHGLQAADASGGLWRFGSAGWVAGGSSHEGSGASEAWFGPVGAPWAAFELAESLREDSIAAIERLRRNGVEVRLLSGDRPQRVAALAERVGVRRWQGAATPEDKQAVVATAQSRGHCVAMVGDGVNDAPVLARADVSFAFAHGADVARMHADAVVLGNRLADVAAARELALRTRRVIRWNFAWAVLYNAACVPLALAGWLPPWAAGLGMACSSLLVVGHSLRLAHPLD